MEFNIGDRVVIKPFKELPAKLRKNATTRICGTAGVVLDKLYSEAGQQYVYRIHLDGFETPSKAAWTADCLVPEPEQQKITYKFDIEVAENIAIVRMYEEGSEYLVATGHGHIFHDGAVGVAQATSYALKRIAEKLGYEFGGKRDV